VPASSRLEQRSINARFRRRRRGVSSQRLAWLGLDLDDLANQAGHEQISVEWSRVAAVVMSTDEEQTLADEALSTITSK
jgi:acetate kinase